MSTRPAHAPIGVFDSGVGGLTVVRALRQRLPQESIVYLGDTARVPYGSKSAAVVVRYALNCAQFLVDAGVKSLLVACNTASAVAIEALAERFDVVVMGVIEPGARLASDLTRGKVGILGTEGTIASGRYQALVSQWAPQAEVLAKACPMLVPLAEEGWMDHPAAELIVHTYVDELLLAGIDTLVLGCTHYPVLEHLIRKVCGPSVQVINSADAVAAAYAATLAPSSTADHAPTYRFYATDAPERFARVGRIFLGDVVGGVDWVDIGTGR